MSDSTSPHRSAFARANDAVHLLGLSFFLAVALAAWAREAESAGTAVLVYGGLLAATAALAGRAAKDPDLPPALRALHVAWPFLVLPGVFTGLRWLAPAVAPPDRRFDDELAAWDLDWCGLDVARWSEGFLTAPLADFFMVFYALYFVMPVGVFAAYILRARREALYRALFTVSAGLYSCYALYLLVPVAGPRHDHVNRSAPLPRGWITGWTHDFIRDLEPQPYDAFPSAHVVLGLLCAALCWRFGGWIRWSVAVVGGLTAVSTVVLRYHYLVDDLAGLVVLATALGAAAFLERRAGRRTASSHGDRMGELLGGPP